MERYHVKITDAALADMDDIYSYIAQKLGSAINAGRQYDRIAQEILELEQMPERFPVMEAPFGPEVGLRRMPVDNYSVFYVVRGGEVIVTDVLYSASDIEARLAERRE